MFLKSKKKAEQKAKKIAGIKKKYYLFFIIYSIFQVIIFYLIKFFSRDKSKIKKLYKKEKKEVDELLTGKENLSKFCKDSFNLFKDFFIPYEGNNHRPHSLRPKALAIYLLVAIVIKIAATGFLFITYPSPAKLAAIVASKMVELTNQARIDNGLSTLKINSVLEQSAIAKGQDMINRGYFSHDTPEGKKPWVWINKSEYDYIYAGENLAMDFTNSEMIQQAFMKSPTHRKNILNPKYQDVGIAVVGGKMNGKQTDILVVFFGTERASLLAQIDKRDTITPAVSNLSDNDKLTVAKTVTETVEKIDEKEITDNTEVQPEIPQLTESIIPITEEDEATILDSSLDKTEGIIVVTTKSDTAKSLVEWVIELSNIIFIAFIIFITLSLLLNIFIKIKIQDAHIIFQSIVVIALITALILTKIHFIEKITPQLVIL